MPESVFLELSKHGILGIILIPVGWYVWQMHKDRRVAETARVTDAQAVVDKLIAINEKWQQAFFTNVETLKTTVETLQQVRAALKDVEDVLADLERNVHRTGASGGSSGRLPPVLR